uniref:Prefoldin subunit 5 n=1 Tax=Plectus sambesii TaxID=2011161 RepID=A0A914VNG1_9BILA
MAQPSGEGKGSQEPRGIPIDQLGMDQLSGLQQQIDKELTFFSESLGELKDVQAKFIDSGEAIALLEPTKSDQEALVPLSESMYVRGTLSRPDKVLVDIGTGYYAEMSHDKAKDYFKRKQDYLGKQIETIQNILLEKQRTRQVIVETLQAKVQAAFQAQQQQMKS